MLIRPDKVYRSASGKTVSVLRDSEHHMSAEHTWLLPSEPIAGVKHFLTTNGDVLFDENKGSFYLHDARLVVRIDSEAWEASSFKSPSSSFIKDLTVEEEGLSVTLIDAHGRILEKKTLNERNWKKDLAMASKGFFPSAHGGGLTYERLLEDMTVD